MTATHDSKADNAAAMKFFIAILLIVAAAAGAVAVYGLPMLGIIGLIGTGVVFVLLLLITVAK
ncbi:MAG: hypothetical protein ACK5LJ_04450 [Paracoccus sp. (in: a-proteobacteria)]